jgi:hypothetical protein
MPNEIPISILPRAAAVPLIAARPKLSSRDTKILRMSTLLEACGPAKPGRLKFLLTRAYDAASGRKNPFQVVTNRKWR